MILCITYINIVHVQYWLCVYSGTILYFLGQAVSVCVFSLSLPLSLFLSPPLPIYILYSRHEKPCLYSVCSILAINKNKEEKEPRGTPSPPPPPPLVILFFSLQMGILLRVATLTDHEFIQHHLLRCPPGVSQWATPFLQVASPLATIKTLEAQFGQRGLCVYFFCLCVYTVCGCGYVCTYCMCVHVSLST